MAVPSAVNEHPHALSEADLPAIVRAVVTMIALLENGPSDDRAWRMAYFRTCLKVRKLLCCTDRDFWPEMDGATLTPSVRAALYRLRPYVLPRGNERADDPAALAGIVAVLRGGKTTDGPVPPNKFRWRGNVCERLSPLQYRLLAYLWDGGRRRGCVGFEELLEHVWEGKDTLRTSLKSSVSRLNTKLNTVGIYLGLATESYNVVCSWGQ
ncbi:MAG TPA: helix-turn-helix domain-containing protein [Gemmataceae bacterium]|nr:helix-turn-helix domain-containing protein [Gemmataceae bacterium]